MKLTRWYLHFFAGNLQQNGKRYVKKPEASIQYSITSKHNV